MSVCSFHGLPLREIIPGRPRLKAHSFVWLRPHLDKARIFNVKIFLSALLILGTLVVGLLFARYNYVSTFFGAAGTFHCVENEQRRVLQRNDTVVLTESDSEELTISKYVVSVLESVSYSKCDANKRLKFSYGASQNMLNQQLKISDIIRGKKIQVAAINLKSQEVSALERAFPGINVVPVNTNINQGLAWENIYPNLVDPKGVACPLHPPYSDYILPNPVDIVVVNAPCNPSDPSWTKNVSRHLLLLAAAELAVHHTSGDFAPVIVMSQCLPTTNLFRCSYLRERRNDLWLFHVDKQDMKKRLLQPVGSCALGSPTAYQGYNDSLREAYATVIHSNSKFVCGAIVLGASLKRSGTTRDLILLHDSHLGLNYRERLRAVGWKLQEIERIRNPKSGPNAYNEWNYSKLRLWQLIQYSKILFIDADLVVVRNMDFLFAYPELSAVTNGGQPTIFNSGLMVIEPSTCTFDHMLMPFIDVIVSYNNGDQGYLNEIFSWWHRLPYEVNFLKYTDLSNPKDADFKSKIFKGNPPPVYGIHYLGLKPWECYRDFDCNGIERPRFSNEDAHKYWWKIHDLLPEQYQRYCYLDEPQKNRLHQLVKEAKQKGWGGTFLNVTVQDKRLYLSNSV